MELDAFLEVSLCPQCRTSRLALAKETSEHDPLQAPSALCCGACGASFPIVGQVIDFLPDAERELTRTQKLMENKRVVSIYERFVRPCFIKLGAPTVTYETEARWLDGVVTPSGGVVVDIAAGTGRYSRYLVDKDRKSTRLNSSH